jgi:hypothetical protein
MHADDVEVLRSTLEDLLREVESFTRDGEPLPPHYLDDFKLLVHLIHSCGYRTSTIRSIDGSLLVVLDGRLEDAA